MNFFLVFAAFNFLFLGNSFAESTQSVLFIGDSLTAGYGVNKEDSFPQVIQTRLRSEGYKIKVLNGSISGSTSASALSRIRWYSKANPKVLILALGANDGLRGVKVEATKNNLQKAIDFAKSKGMKVLLAGMMLPPNYGKEYTSQFKKMYSQLSKSNSLPTIPFLLEGVAGEKDLNIEDGIHPNEKGHKKMAENVYPHLKALL
ncbi:MAG: arylesterase [Oligoflexia bacterium]|nr:arylesterase [Oligoflexia bacterium]